MAAYASLVSLMNLIDQLQNHPRPPITLAQQHVESLRKHVAFLQEFLEVYPHDVIKQVDDEVEGRIAAAAYAVEDLIESYIADQIQLPSVQEQDGGSTIQVRMMNDFNFEDLIQDLIWDMKFIDHIQNHPCHPITLSQQHVESLLKDVVFLKELKQRSEVKSFVKRTDYEHRNSIAMVAYALEDMIQSYLVGLNGGSTIEGAFYQQIEKVISGMSCVLKEVAGIQEKLTVENCQLAPTRSLGKYESTRQRNVVVVFDDVLIEVMDKLTGYPRSLQVIPIQGMGGIGKTTLAKIAYQHSTIRNYFDILVWATISQNYTVREILLQFHEMELSDQTSEAELGIKLYKTLFGRRYLIVMDDMWSIQAWDEVKKFFPNNTNGSRVMVTTRLLPVASQLNVSYNCKMNFLDEDRSWNLLCKCIFGDDACPLGELVKIGRRIAKDCNGLPLSIVVIGGFLAKSQMTLDYWEYIAEHLKSFLYLEDEERCLQILHTSYSSLPVHLKSCFLYLGVFDEDSEIDASKLINMWIAEGFVKPISGKSLEEAAKCYLDDLVDRSLIFRKYEFKGRSFCYTYSMHDLIRDLCLREAEKEKFLFDTLKHDPHVEQGVNPHCRLAVYQSTSECHVFDVLQSSSQVRTLISSYTNVDRHIPLKLCRVLKGAFLGEQRLLDKVISQLVNSRFLYINWTRIPTWISYFWNLQTIVIDGVPNIALDIWKMYQLKHVEASFLLLTDVPPIQESSESDFVLDNLQMLSLVFNFVWSEEVIKRIPNIKNLGILVTGGSNDYHLHNLGHLQKLQHLSCWITPGSKKEISLCIKFSYSLTRLHLQGFELHWDEITTRIGSLPLLQELYLNACGASSEWNLIEGYFISLKSLTLEKCNSLRIWTAESTHFPCLEHLLLEDLDNLTEIPFDIGDIPTLQYIKVYYCNESLGFSAQNINEEQAENGNDTLKVDVRVERFMEQEDDPAVQMSNLELQLLTDAVAENMAFGSSANLDKDHLVQLQLSTSSSDMEDASLPSSAATSHVSQE